jgi:hypothetical protein
MATIENVDKLIKEYSERLRPETNFKAEISNLYNLKKMKGSKEFGWPDPWPHGGSPGIYVILHEEEVLYIGKASLQWIGDRLSSYFRYGEKRECIQNRNHNWKKPPTHVVAWKVPKDQFYEASAMEEYLINKLQGELSGNTQGISA